MTGPRGSVQAGETLVELLISIMIIGISVTAILGGVRIAVAASTLDQRQIHAQALLRSWGEYAVGQTTDANYTTSCATSLTYPATLQALPAGFTAAQTKLEFWNGTSFAGGACSTDPGVRRIELTMSVAPALYPGFTSTYDVVVRRPCLTVGGGGC
jgi:Tfp pilus assembly protein PilV